MSEIFKVGWKRCEYCGSLLTKTGALAHLCIGARAVIQVKAEPKQQKLPQTRTELVLCVVKGERK